MKDKTRTNKRAKNREATRLAIIEAAVELHETIGPSLTTISAIAELAGVRRATIYSHFPSDGDLHEACKNHFINLNPLPSYKVWLAEPTPEARLRRALEELYLFHQRTSRMMSNILRDAELVPSVGERVEQYVRYFSEIADKLSEGWQIDPDRKPALRAAIGHALSFYTWRSLVAEQSMSRSEAVSAMMAFVEMMGKPQNEPRLDASDGSPSSDSADDGEIS